MGTTFALQPLLDPIKSLDKKPSRKIYFPPAKCGLQDDPVEIIFVFVISHASQDPTKWNQA
jgi:hypothetical protein